MLKLFCILTRAVEWLGLAIAAMTDHGVRLHSLIARGPPRDPSPPDSDSDEDAQYSSEASMSWKGGPDDRGDLFATTSGDEEEGCDVELYEILRNRSVLGILIQFVGDDSLSRLRMVLHRRR